MRGPRPSAFLLLVFLLLCLPGRGLAQFGPPEPTFRGYLKTLALAYRAPRTALASFITRGGRLYYSRARIEGRMPLSGDLYLQAAAELEDLSGEGGGTLLLRSGGRGGPAWRPEWVLRDEQDLAEGQGPGRTRLFLDRCYLEAYSGPWTVTVGKQRVAWGSGQFWNPTDLFDPFGPLSLDAEDRPGSDALRVDRQLGPVSVLTGVFSVGSRSGWHEDLWDRSVQVLRLRTHLGDWDIVLLGAQDRGDSVAGLDLSGYVGDAGVYMESAVVRHPERLRLYGTGGEIIWQTLGSDTWIEAVAGGSYGFESGWTVRGELFFNGGGTASTETYPGGAPRGRYLEAWTDYSRGDLLALSRMYAAGFVRWQLTPLVSSELGTLVNLSDGGSALLPGLDWSVLSDLRVHAGAQVFLASSPAEFSYYPLSGYVLLKYSF